MLISPRVEVIYSNFIRCSTRSNINIANSPRLPLQAIWIIASRSLSISFPLYKHRRYHSRTCSTRSKFWNIISSDKFLQLAAVRYSSVSAGTNPRRGGRKRGGIDLRGRREGRKVEAISWTPWTTKRRGAVGGGSLVSAARMAHSESSIRMEVTWVISGQ